MKITVQAGLNPDQVLRKAGYGQLRDRRSGQTSYVRRLGSGFYPRFHVYINNNVINLHLDQKQASYQGTSAHSGEYDGETVEREGERIKAVMQAMASETTIAVTQPTKDNEENKGFWGRLFS